MEDRALVSESDEDEPVGVPVKSETVHEEERKPWDGAQSYPPGEETEAVDDEAVYVMILKTLKILAYIVTFLVALSCAVVSKSSLLMMTSQIRPERRVPYCAGLGRKLEATIPSLEMISWSWAIFFAFAVPEVLVLLRSIRIWLFKATERPNLLQFFVPFFFETCHVFGLSLFAFIVLPSMNVVRGAMLTNAVCLIPAIFSLLCRAPVQDALDPKNDGRVRFFALASVDMVSIIFLLTGLVLWPILNKEPSIHPWMLPLSCLLISFGWWENYVDRASLFAPLRGLAKLKLGGSRYVTYFYLSIWKMAVFIGGMALSFWILDQDYTRLFHDFTESFQPHNISITEIRPPVSNGSSPDIPGNGQFYGNVLIKENISVSVQYTLMIQILTTFMCYQAGKFACKIGIQGFSFAFPLNLAVPVTLVFLVTMCGVRDDNTCFWKSFPPYLYWDCPRGNLFTDFIGKQHGWVWILWLLAQTWVTLHIWNPKFRRLETAEILFVAPGYNALLIDQSLTQNRRRKAFEYTHDEEPDEEGGNYDNATRDYPHMSNEAEQYYDRDSIPKIYACATMWHEIKEEMVEMLKSIFRMDLDQCERRIARNFFDVNDPDYYEFETHIFFDDAFTKDKTDKTKGKANKRDICNDYVKDMVNTLEKAASLVHERDVILRPPTKVPTPYGGRLIWILPGRTKLIVHLKNKDKIRHKKRWSQVMYMYYFLGHKLLDRPIPTARKEVIAENTFILALDGDIDFKPQAVRLLVDLMKKNKTLGAACGRIHPIGQGIMVWYQKFEYAIGHWFQKATEHVIGCVLCSPGCFSLFRGKALLDDNVMAKYTTESSEPRHYVQYDQGEDRWLCTLILQQGWRVEYSAASDSFTHAPEAFDEFFQQRRRWVPSTMANIFDVLMDYKRTMRMNPNISYPYIGYQMLMMIGSILGPGSIFLMLIGAFNAAFKIPNVTCFIWNVIPILLFILICFFFDSKIQLIVAQILSAIYALIMVAVVVALMMQIQEDGPLAPSSLFLFGVAASFIIAAMLHPLEFGCLPHGLVYYITIPSMYLILIIYSLMNLNIVSWGTREVAPDDDDDDKVAAVEAKVAEKPGGLLGFLTSKLVDDTEGSFEISCAGLFKFMCCTKPVDKSVQLVTIAASLDEVNKRLETLSRTHGVSPGMDRRISVISNQSGLTSAVNVAMIGSSHPHPQFPPPAKPAGNGNEPEYATTTPPLPEPEIRDDLLNPYWMDDLNSIIRESTVDFLTGNELKFWKELIKKYLEPLAKDERKEKILAQQLIDLRNKMIFFFFMVNAVFVLAIFLLQNNKDTIHIEWPLGGTVNMTYSGGNQIYMQKNSLQLEPIGVVFVAVFAVILSIQFVAMLFHRFGTFCHILASTIIGFCTKDVNDIAKEQELEKEGLALVRIIQRGKEDAGVPTRRRSTRATHNDAARRKTIHNLERVQSGSKKQQPLDIVPDFQRRYTKLASEEGQARLSQVVGGNNRRITFQNLVRRNSVMQQRRQSSITENNNRRSFASGNAQQRPSTSLGVPYQRTSGGGQAEYNNAAFNPDE